MDDHAADTYHESDKGTGPSGHSYQSVWMSHWMRTSYDAATPNMDHLSSSSGNKENNFETEQQHLTSEMDSHRSSKRFKLLGGQTSEIMEGNRKNVNNLKNSSPMTTLFQNGECSSASKSDRGFGHFQVSRPQIDDDIKNSSFPILAMVSSRNKTSSERQHVYSDNSQSRCMKSHLLLGEKNMADFRPLRDDLTVSTSHIVSYSFDHVENKVLDDGRAIGPSIIHKQEEIKHFSPIGTSKEHLTNAKLAMMEHEYDNYGRHSALLVYEKNMGICSGKSPVLDVVQNDTSSTPNDPSTSNYISPMFCGKSYPCMKNCSNIKLFPSQIDPPDMTILEKQHHGCQSIQKPPFVNVENTRICNAADSVKGLPGSTCKFSQTFRSFLITKNTDVNLGKENQVLRASRLSAHFNGSAFHKLGSFSPSDIQGSTGSQFLPLEVTKDCKGNQMKTSGVPQVVLKNESSAETDTMDMNAFRKNDDFVMGANSSSSIKDDKGQETSSASGGKQVECRGHVNGISGFNLELPALPAPVRSHTEASNSRTQSLEMGQQHSNTEQPSTSNFNLSLGAPSEQEPASRWIKRLKLAASDSIGIGTKRSNLVDSTSHPKVNNFFSKMMKSSISDPAQTFSRQNGKDSTRPDQNEAELRIEKSSSDDKMKSQDAILSDPWIQRWCQKDTSPRKNTVPSIICKPQCLRLELEKEQFPSIAAMALMGKAMRGFEPCEFQKKGSFVVWNTNRSF